MARDVGRHRRSTLKYTALAGIAAPYIRRVADERALREELKNVALSARRIFDGLSEARSSAHADARPAHASRALWRRAIMIGAAGTAVTGLLVHPRTGPRVRAWIKRPLARVGEARQFTVRPFRRHVEERADKAA